MTSSSESEVRGTSACVTHWSRVQGDGLTMRAGELIRTADDTHLELRHQGSKFVRCTILPASLCISVAGPRARVTSPRSQCLSKSPFTAYQASLKCFPVAGPGHHDVWDLGTELIRNGGCGARSVYKIPKCGIYP